MFPCNTFVYQFCTQASIDKECTTDDDGTIRQKNKKYYPIWQTNIYLEGNFGDFGLGFSPGL